MRTKLLLLTTAVLTIILSCVETTSVEAPADIDPNTTFMVTVNLVDTDSFWVEDYIVYLAVLIPEIWSVDSVYGDGCGFAGPLDTLSAGQIYGPYFAHPPASGYLWSSWETPVGINGDYGETGYAEVFISATDSLGLFQLAFCAATWGYGDVPNWEDYPCSCIVEVTPLNLQQETWGHIKAEF